MIRLFIFFIVCYSSLKAEDLHHWTELYYKSVDYLKLRHQDKIELPAKPGPAAVVVERLSSWIKVDIGSFSQSTYLARFKSDYSDTVFSHSIFSNKLLVPLPKKGLGSFLKIDLSPYFSLSAGLSDSNACKLKPGYDTAFDLKEWFGFFQTDLKNQEVGQFSFTAWQQNRLKKKKQSSAYGVVSYFEPHISFKVLPFLRLTYVNSSWFQVARSVSFGLGFKAPFEREKDYVGVMSSWYNQERGRDQTSLETYYKYETKWGLCLTPHLQLNYHPIKHKGDEAELSVGIKLKSLF